MQETAATQAEIGEAKRVASSFLTELYTIEDYNSFTQQDQILYPNDPKTQRIKVYTTDKYYTQQLVASNDILYFIAVAQWNKCNFQVDKVTLVKYAEDTKDKNIIFTTDVYLNCKFKDGTEKSASIRGQIIMERDSSAWKVGYYTVTNYAPKEIFDKSFISKNNIGVSRIIEEFLPHPYNPAITPDSLLFKGKWKGNVMPEFETQMKNMGWELYNGMGAKKFYKKDIDGKEIKISIVPKEEGGSEEKNSSTLITVELEE